MTEPFLAFPESRIRVNVDRARQYIGSVNLAAYKQDLAELVSRLPRTQWEDINPDYDPSVPLRPTWRHTEYSTEAQEIVNLIDRYLDRDDEIITEHAREQAKVVAAARERLLASVRTFTLEDNYDRCLKVEARIREGYAGCWFVEKTRVKIKDTDGKLLEVNASLLMWLLEYGDTVTSETWLKHQYAGHWAQKCVRPDHFTRHN